MSPLRPCLNGTASRPSSIDPVADVISSRTDLAGLQIFLPDIGPTPERAASGPPQIPPAMNTAMTHPTIQGISQLPCDTSDPTTLLTSHGMQVLGLKALPAAFSSGHRKP